MLGDTCSGAYYVSVMSDSYNDAFNLHHPVYLRS